PSMLSVMLSSSRMRECSSIRDIVCSGEALPSTTVQEFYAQTKEMKLHNLYGPTEASIDVTSYSCNGDENIIPIGKAIQNIELYILDSNNNRVPFGAIGELCIAGDGLARGYLNRDDLTDEKFINHPLFGRIYKTGDIAKYLADGNIEYLGRVDDQVKIRGFRVELGEIENAISSVDTVEGSVVIVKDEQLIAYIVGDSNGVKEHLKERLPSYMIPSFFVELEDIPLTSNGKVDKKSLPMPDKLDNEKVYREPSTSIQKDIADIFTEVLKLERISIDDNFFEIGGHSLNAINIISAVNGITNKDVKLSHIFKYPTIEDFSYHLEKLKSTKEDRELYTVFNPEKKKSIFIFPTIIASIDHAFLDRMSGFLSEYKIYAFDFIIDDNRIEQYVDIISSLENEFVFFGYSSGGTLAYEVIKRLQEKGLSQPKRLISLDSWMISELNYIPKDFRITMIDKAKEHGLGEYECEKIVKYMDMIDSTINQGEIDVDIDYISNSMSTKEDISETIEDWKGLTSKEVFFYAGFGEHEDMVRMSLKQNCKIIGNILDNSGFKDA
ncbi:AMP-binding protein, partial [Sulfurovum sp. bin170]|uniref:non-ribosomal peptide synthetase n=1 Tax=Sulfurovum sp. bin170 TaxID=2695268 RepID=UPI0013DF7D8E